jgi:hypothetical protein
MTLRPLSPVTLMGTLMGTLMATLAGGLALAGLALAQTPGQAPEARPIGRRTGQEGRLPGSFYSDMVTPETHRSMQGVWRIEKMDWRGQSWAGGDIAGFAVIDQGHMALELHVKIFVNSAQEMLLQTGIYRYDFDEVGQMVTHALIGTDTIQDPLEVTPTPPGEGSRFRVRLGGDVLVLTRPESSLTMRRAVQPPPPFHDPRRARQTDRLVALIADLDAEQLERIVNGIAEDLGAGK